MAEIKIKRSSVPGKAPLPEDLVLGELAINTFDGKLFLKRNNGTESVVEVGGEVATPAIIPVSTTPPENPVDSSLWWDSSSGSLKIYYNDGSSSQWVDASSEKSAVSTENTSSQPSNVFFFEGTTTDSAEKELFVNNELNNRLLVTTGTSIYYTIDISCRRTDGSDFAAFTLKGVVANSGGTVVDIGSIYEIVVVRTDVALSVDARANTSTGSLEVYVTGVLNKAFKWNAQLTVVEV
jgi:hypothetical protein